MIKQQHQQQNRTKKKLKKNNEEKEAWLMSKKKKMWNRDRFQFRNFYLSYGPPKTTMTGSFCSAKSSSTSVDVLVVFKFDVQTTRQNDSKYLDNADS